MRVIFLGFAVPNLNEYHNMFTDLMLEFKNNGHEIVIVGPAYDDTHLGVQIEDNITVLRVATMKLFLVGKFQKGIATLLLPRQYKKALKKSGINLNFDLVLMPTPPITLADVASWLKKKTNSKVYLILRDIFPQNALDLKMMSKGTAYSYFRKKEKKMYKIADAIGCMSPGNIDFVKNQNPNLDSKKLHLLPNWGRLDALDTKEEIYKIKGEYKLKDKFTVMFGGNIGRPQKMENVVALAKACLDIPDIFFLIIGGGNEKENLEKMILTEKLDNVKIYDFLSGKDYFKVLQCVDVALISLSQDFTIPNIPSKSLMYFNAKKPILASTDKNTDFGTIIEEIDAGLWAEAGNTPMLKEKLLFLYNNEDARDRMGQNGYDHYKKSLLTPMAYATITKEYNGH